MIRYKKLGYVELNVTNLDRSIPFYRDMVGLEPIGQDDSGAALFRCSEDHHAVVLHQAPVAGCKRVGWMLESDAQFANAEAALRNAGTPFETVPDAECHTRRMGRAVRFSEPLTGCTVELYVNPPNAEEQPFVPTHTRIQRLGHVVFGTPHIADAARYHLDVLNFRKSDALGENIAFFRPFPNPYHHGLGIAQAKKRVFNHLNFMVSEIDDIGRGFNRMRKNDVTVVYGPGRHPASGSMFLYFLDPDGMTLEYSFGMEEFAEIEPRAPRDIAPTPENFDSWGSPRDPRMSQTGEIECYKVAGAV